MGDEAERWKWEGRAATARSSRQRSPARASSRNLHRERYRLVDEVQASMRAAGLAPPPAIGQCETEDGLVLTEDCDEDRDHKIVHVARIA